MNSIGYQLKPERLKEHNLGHRPKIKTQNPKPNTQ